MVLVGWYGYDEVDSTQVGSHSKVKDHFLCLCGIVREMFVTMSGKEPLNTFTSIQE